MCYDHGVSSLMPVGGDGPVARCGCGREAAGPCARCRRPTCGDCCELVSGGASTFAVCLACMRQGSSFGGAWRGLLGWLALIVVALIAVAATLVIARG